MLAYIVDDETVNKIVSYLYAKAVGGDTSIVSLGLVRMGFDLSNADHAERLAKAMSVLNVYAVNEKDGKGEAVKLTRQLDFKYLFTPATQIEVIKALETWKYQCTEEGIPMSPLYQAMVQIHCLLCSNYIHQLEEYEAAPWG